MTKDEQISITKLAAKVGSIETALADHITYTKAAAKSETDRIDAILRANAEALKQANGEAGESRASAARQTEEVAKTLREVVEATRLANEKSLSEVINPITSRLDEVEKKQYEDKGRSGLSTPLLMMLATLGGGVLFWIIQLLAK